MTGPAVVVVDYGMGNRRSVQKALEHVGAAAQITADPELIAGADGIVVPGVGAFPLAMRNLRRLQLADPIRRSAAAGRPLLGICLGMQVLFERSEEFDGSEGLGLLGGEVTRLDARGLRIPHIGWNEVALERDCELSAGLPRGGCPFYHVHSMAVRPSDGSEVVGTAEYGERFATYVARENVFGVQFHPEKSSGHGLTLLANFVRLCAAAADTPAGATAARA